MTATDEGQPRPARLLGYIAIAAISSLVAVLPGIGRDDDSSDQASAAVATATEDGGPPVASPPTTTTTSGSLPSTLLDPTVSLRTPTVSLSSRAAVSSPGTTTPPPSTATTTTTPPPYTWPDPPPPAPLRTVSVPSNGIYLGAYVNSYDVNGDGSVARVLTDLPDFRRQFGRNLAIVGSYQPWNGPWVLNENLTTIADSYGAIPMVSWRCGVSNERIVSGGEDALIFRFAQQLKDYGRPVMLRWFWEFNLVNQPAHVTCLGSGTEAEKAERYAAAYRRIVDIFRLVGADNVAFVWCAATAGVAADMEQFYPGDDYVDWIGADGYSRNQRGRPAFGNQFNRWYAAFAGRGKPMIVAETGATTDQVDYLAGIEEVLPRDYPQIKALLYFDAAGGTDWRLTSYGGVGMAAFARLGQNPYFGAMGEP